MTARKGGSKPAWQRETVEERIRILFRQAENESGMHPERSRRYVEMATKLSMRYNVRISPGLKRRFCSRCKSFLVPGKNCTVRTEASQKSVIFTCKSCGNISRYPYRKENAEK
jgi:ribonuclease P protein subunit RPR2